MKKPLKILMVEDNLFDAALIRLELRKTNKEFESRIVQDEKNFLNELETFEPDLILSGYTMPQFTGLDALDIAKKKCPEVPFIIVTGTLNDEIAIKCIRWGAWDYVLKDRLVHLGHAVKNAIKLKAENEKKKLAEEALLESEEKYRTLINSIQDGVFLIQDGLMKLVNPAFASMIGYNVKEVIGMDFRKLIAPEDVEMVAERYRRRQAGEDITSKYEFKMLCKDGKTLAEVLISIGIINFKGKVASIGTVHDITERKQAEKALLESEKKYRDLFEKSKDAILIIHDGKFVDCNQSTISMLGYNSKDEFLNTHPSELSPEKQPDGKMSFTKANEMMKIALKKGSHRFEWNHKKSDGIVFPVEVLLTAISIHENNQILHTVWRDITERKRAEDIQKTLLNISNALNTTDHMPDLYSKIREFLGNVIDTTNFYVALYDEKTDMISLPFDVDEKDDFETFPAGKTLTKYVIQSGKPLFAPHKLQEELTEQGEIEIIGTRSEIWLGAPLKIENHVIGVIAVQSYDDPNLYTEKDMEILSFVSDEIALAINKKRAEEQIKRDLEEKEILLQEIHHRVKNNMQIVSSLLKLQSAHIKDKRALELFQNSQDRVKTMSLIHDALYRSKDLAHIDFEEYVRKLTTQIFVSYGTSSNLIKIKINIKDVLIDISTAIPCGLIINELVSNSLKYAFPKGRKGEITIGFTYEDQVNTLRVKDNGIGISGEIDLDNSPTLGLLLVNSLAKQLDGTLKLEKVKGTSFQITFKEVELKTYGKVQS